MPTIKGGLPLATAGFDTDYIPVDQLQVDGSYITKAVSTAQHTASARKYSDWKGRSATPMAACRQYPVNTASMTDTTSNSINGRIMFTAPALSDLTDIIVAMPAQTMNLGVEADFPTTYTIKAYIEYPFGTFTQLYSGNSTTITVVGGRSMPQFDPCPITIPRGGQGSIKYYMTFTAGNMPLTVRVAAAVNVPYGEWCVRGTGVADNTTNTTYLTTTSSYFWFPLAIFATLSTPIPVLGIIGASQSNAADNSNVVNPQYSGVGYERAMLGQIPVINVAAGGDGASNYLARPHGRSNLLRNRITHLIFDEGSNDLYVSGITAAALKVLMLSAIQTWLTRGVKIFVVSVTPRTTSSNGYLDRAGQSITNAPANAQRLLFNADLRANWASYGFSGIFDIARVVDPTDSSIWNVDAGGVVGENSVVGYGGSGYTTISAGAVTACSLAQYQGASSGGLDYPHGTNVPCVTYAYPGDPGTGFTATMLAGTVGFGNGLGFTVVTPGSGYLFPPMCSPVGQWSNNDGVHLAARGWDEVIHQLGICPATFAL